MKKRNKRISEDSDNYNKSKNPNDDKRDTMEIDIISENPEDKKKSKCEVSKKDKKFDIKKFEKKSTPNGIDDKKIIEVKKIGGKDSNKNFLFTFE